jgi:hypothetical protein
VTGYSTDLVRHAIVHWLQNEQHRQLLQLTAEEVAAAWAQTRSDSWDMHLAGMKSALVAGNLVTLMAATHVYNRSIFIVQPHDKKHTPLPHCNAKHAKRIVLIARADGNFEVAPLHRERDGDVNMY